MPHYAQSTIAMTAYNMILRISELEPTAEGIHSHAMFQISHPTAELEEVRSALDELETRKFIVIDSEGRASSADPQRRTCVLRSREGDGWGGWMVRNEDKTLTPLAEAVGG